jgi:stage V sporulation protein S
METIFKVSSHSVSIAVAGAIAGSMRDGDGLDRLIDRTSTDGLENHPIAIARRFLAKDGLDMICVPEFVELELDGNERTAVRFYLGPPGNAFPPAKPFSPRTADGEKTANPAASHNSA